MYITLSLRKGSLNSRLTLVMEGASVAVSCTFSIRDNFSSFSNLEMKIQEFQLKLYATVHQKFQKKSDVTNSDILSLAYTVWWLKLCFKMMILILMIRSKSNSTTILCNHNKSLQLHTEKIVFVANNVYQNLLLCKYNFMLVFVSV